ncbi:hypothetical protein STSP2_01979 [Anaerohalosphaera lusitana]|uniref:Ice-binding protein C-terminal domain-containing protein n=1 Tax=Anaerohalosphaera lusitana TaxID=1936003 RepID=A0A1U9NM43_9BACT|nr:PEP-CTERM sorting domain-containing protein [Anaerohalosphaera lusitana]AQT68804.1 hypothetical protein STSP2_01979 [Anaerohalosphaera lusitana]
MKITGAHKRFLLISLSVVLFPCCLYAGVDLDGLNTGITFRVSELEAGRWQYDYTVENISLPEGIGEFTIYFDPDHCSALRVETAGLIADTWNEFVWDPVRSIGVEGGYDAMAGAFPIGPSMIAYGFSVSFDWSGQGRPGAQYYEIIDPETFEEVDSGWTVPEPSTLALLCVGVFFAGRKRG